MWIHKKEGLAISGVTLLEGNLQALQRTLQIMGVGRYEKYNLS
jgi:hypothetical protein